MSKIEHTDLLIGIDDTDNADSRGTGFNARQLAHRLEKETGAEVKGITRHQLFVNDAIRYTSQNSSACIVLECNDMKHVLKVCEDYLKRNSAAGSDAGLCIANPDQIDQHIINWGNRAKVEVLSMVEAREHCKKRNIYLEGFTGTHEGIIGAMAAVGLRMGGNDGRFIWRKGKKELREMEAGIMQVEVLMKALELDTIQNIDGETAQADDQIMINEWVRPILKGNKTILIAQKIVNDDEFNWKIATKEIVRAIS